jgi:hypothetical protein
MPSNDAPDIKEPIKNDAPIREADGPVDLEYYN